MKKTIIYLFLLYVFISSTYAITLDSITTTYKDGTFNTQYITKAKVSSRTVNNVSDNLVNEFHYSTIELFKWALKDLGLQDESNEIIIIFKSSSHDSKTNITQGIFDIEVPYFRTYKNIKANAIVSKTINNSVTKVNANVLYSSLLLDKCQATLYFVPKKNKEYNLYANVSIKFGWFFNIFITKSRYKNIVEWRIKQFTQNMKEECELRETK